MNVRSLGGKSLRLFLGALIMSFVFQTTAWAAEVAIPINTKVYVETVEPVSGKKKHTQEGQLVNAVVWRDVVVDGTTVIRAGTPVVVRVDSIKGAKVAGVKGKMTLGAYETTLTDDSRIRLSGGYYKEGKGRVALSATLAAFVFLPLIFIKGKAANLPSGTVFDAYIDERVTMDLPDAEPAATAPRTVNLTGVVNREFDAEVLYDELEAVEKPEVFAFAIQTPPGSTGQFVIDVLNGEDIKPMKLDVTQTGDEGDLQFWRGEIKIKELAKELKKGINTFEVSTVINGIRVSKEIVLDIQI